MSIAVSDTGASQKQHWLFLLLS